MTSRPQQLAFDLHFRAALGREDFLVSPVNAIAVAAIDAWHGWTQQAHAIAGPAGSGKSHLVEVWRSTSRAVRLSAATLDETAIGAATEVGAVAVEDIDRGIGDERVLFHLFNLAREGRLWLLVTTRALPGEIEIALPDLRSRLRAVELSRIDTPDEGLLRALLVKLMADRQLEISPKVIEYVVRRMERSADAARRFVADLDRQALAARRDVTVPLAREVLDAHERGRAGDP
jgi:chromosomal replication initiation ATPase DnaA